MFCLTQGFGWIPYWWLPFLRLQPWGPNTLVNKNNRMCESDISCVLCLAYNGLLNLCRKWLENLNLTTGNHLSRLSNLLIFHANVITAETWNESTHSPPLTSVEKAGPNVRNVSKSNRTSQTSNRMDVIQIYVVFCVSFAWWALGHAQCKATIA